MIYFSLTELGNILKLDIAEELDDIKNNVKIIEDATILDIDKATFSIKYSIKYGEIVSDTITADPSIIYDRLAKARNEIERREIAFMKNIFLLDKDSYIASDGTIRHKSKPRIKKSSE